MTCNSALETWKKENEEKIRGGEGEGEKRESGEVEGEKRKSGGVDSESCSSSYEKLEAMQSLKLWKERQSISENSASFNSLNFQKKTSQQVETLSPQQPEQFQAKERGNRKFAERPSSSIQFLDYDSPPIPKSSSARTHTVSSLNSSNSSTSPTSSPLESKTSNGSNPLPSFLTNSPLPSPGSRNNPLPSFLLNKRVELCENKCGASCDQICAQCNAFVCSGCFKLTHSFPIFEKHKLTTPQQK